MSTRIHGICCTVCQEREVAYSCAGCKQTFCFKHLTEHHRQFEEELDKIQDQRNEFLQILNEQHQNPENNSFVQQINRWERESIEKVKRTADEARKSLIKYLYEHVNQTKTKLIELTGQIKEIRDANNYNEIHLKDFSEKLKGLRRNFDCFSNIKIQQQPNSFIKKISVEVRHRSWVQEGTTIIGINQCGQPWSIDIDDEENLYISDCKNHCIMKWTKATTTNEIIIGENGKGNSLNQLNEPRSIVLDKQNNCLYIADSGNRRVMKWCLKNNIDREGEIIISNINCWGLTLDDKGCIYTSDIDKHEIRRWNIGENFGILVAGSGAQGDRLNQLNNPYFIFVDHEYSVYVSDYGNHRIVKWLIGTKQGIIVADNKDSDSNFARISCPLGIIVNQLGTIYVADSNNHRIIQCLSGYYTISFPMIGGGSCGSTAYQFNTPYAFVFDRQHNLYAVDYGNKRIQKFDIQ